MDIKALIFDLGNVVLDFNHMFSAKRMSEFTDKESGSIYQAFFDSPLTGLFEEGKLGAHEFFSGMQKNLGLKIDFDAFLPIWNEIFFMSEKNLGVYHLAHKLKMRYPLALLTNINALHFEYIKANFPVLDAFHHVITSFEAGSRKPDAQIYHKALNALGLPAENVFYTDDRQELVESASRLGINSFVFAGFPQLIANLKQAGVLSE